MSRESPITLSKHIDVQYYKPGHLGSKSVIAKSLIAIPHR